jgi:rod shape-determining protein MreC
MLFTAGGLLLLSLVLTSYSSRNPWTAQIGSWVLAEIERPFQKLFVGGSSSLLGLWSRYLGLIQVQEQNTILSRRLAALEAENSRLVESEIEVERLRALLGFVKEHQLVGKAATVIGWDPSNWVKVLALDLGLRHGVKQGMAVIHDKGVVGQVIASGLSSARVQLITDHSSGVDAIVQGSRVRGTLVGQGTDLCRLDFIPSDQEVQVGDRVITSGMDAVFPKGLFLGVVISVNTGSGLFRQVEVKPALDFRRLESAFVLLPKGET